jgi:hypothetical protein
MCIYGLIQGETSFLAPDLFYITHFPHPVFFLSMLHSPFVRLLKDPLLVNWSTFHQSRRVIDAGKWQQKQVIDRYDTDLGLPIYTNLRCRKCTMTPSPAVSPGFFAMPPHLNIHCSIQRALAALSISGGSATCFISRWERRI